MNLENPENPDFDRRRDALARQRARALSTNSEAWRRIRARQLTREPWCEVCRDRPPGRFVRAVVVDHIDGNDRNQSDENLRSMCRRCHGVKSVRHDGALGHRINREKT